MELIYYKLLVCVTVVMGNPCLNQILTRVPYSYNCNTFIVCWMSTPYFQSCPIGFLFDIKTNNCEPWPIAMCCNFVYPQSRRPLPPSPSTLSDGKLVRRILPPIQNTFSTKLLPDDVNTQLTQFPTQQSTIAQKLPTKITNLTESRPINDKITTRSKEPAPPTTKSFVTLETSPDTSIPVISQILLPSRSSLANETKSTTVFVTTSLVSTQEHLSKPTKIGANVTESTTKDGLEPRPSIPIFSTIVSALTTPVIGLTSTEQQVSKQISTEHITTKVATSAHTEIETERPTTPSDSAAVLKETTTTLTPKIISHTLQPITITTLSHESDPTTILPQSTFMSLETIATKEIKKSITEKNISIKPTERNSKVTESVHESSTGLTDSGKTFSSVTTNIPPLTITTSSPVLITKSVGSTKASVKTDINTSTTNGAVVTTSNISEEYTAFKSKSTTDIKSIVSDLNTAIGTLATISASKSTLTPTIPTLTTNGDTIITSNTSKESTTSIVSSITEINSNGSEPKPVYSTLATISTSKTILLPIISTLATSGATAITNDPSVESTTSKVTRTTDNNPIGTEPNTAINTLTSISASKATLIPTLATNKASSLNSATSIEPTTSKVTSITEINSNGSEPNTASSTLATISASKSTSTPLISTLATNKATSITNDPSVALTTSKVTRIADISSIGTEPNTASSELATIFASKSNSIPLISTLVTNEATYITSDPSVKSTTSKVTRIADISSIGTEPNTATSTLALISASKTTLISLTSTLATNRSTAIMSGTTLKTTSSKVTNIATINSNGNGSNTASITLATISASKSTSTPLIPTLATDEVTSIISDPSVESTTSKVTKNIDVISIGTKPNIFTGILATISVSKQTVLPIIPITAVNGTNVINNNTSGESTSSTSIGTSENYITTEPILIATDHALTTAAIKTTKYYLPPALTTLPTEEPCGMCSTNTKKETPETSTTNGVTAITSDPPVELATPKVTRSTDINSKGTERNTATSTLVSISENKTTLLPLMPTLATNGAITITSYPSIQSTTSKVTKITDINSKSSVPNIATGTLATISESKQTVLPIIPTSAVNGTNVINNNTSGESTSSTSIGTSENYITTEPILIATDHALTTAAIKTIKYYLPPALTTLPTEEPCGMCSTNTKKETPETSTTNGVTAITSDPPVELATPKETRSTDINSIGTERNTATSTLVSISENKTTLLPLMPTLVTNGAITITSYPSIQSTSSKVTKITDINSKSSVPNIATGTLATISESKQTVLPIVPTSAVNGTNVINNNTSGESTSSTSIGTSENYITTEPIRIATDHTLTTAAIKTTKYYLPPALTTIPTEEPCGICSTNTKKETPETSTTNEATAITSDLPVEPTTSKVIRITDINSIGTESNTATSTLTSISANKITLLPLTPTLPTNGATAIFSDTTLESTTSKVINITEINSNSSELSTTSNTQATISTSKLILIPTIPTLATKRATSITNHSSVESTSSKVTSITSINSPYNATGTLATIYESEQTVLPIIPTSAVNGSNAINSNNSVESTTSTSIVSSLNYITTEPNRIVTDHATSVGIQTSTYILSPTTASTKDPCEICSTNTIKETPEAITTNGATAITSDPPVESTTSKVTKEDSETIPILDLTISSAVTEKYTSFYTTNRPLILSSIPTEIPITKSNTSTMTASAGLKEITEMSTSGTGGYSTVTDLNTPAKLSTLMLTTILTSGKPSLSDTTVTQTSKSNIVSTKRPRTPTTSIIITDLPHSIGTTEQKKTALYPRRTLRPMPNTPNRLCPFYTSSKTNEAPKEPQLPDCFINDNFVYPDFINCNFYYYCSNGIIQRLNCRPKFGFNPHLMKCIPEERAQCGVYKSAADQKIYYTSFMLFNHNVKRTQSELNKDRVES